MVPVFWSKLVRMLINISYHSSRGSSTNSTPTSPQPSQLLKIISSRKTFLIRWLSRLRSRVLSIPSRWFKAPILPRISIALRRLWLKRQGLMLIFVINRSILSISKWWTIRGMTSMCSRRRTLRSRKSTLLLRIRRWKCRGRWRRRGIREWGERMYRIIRLSTSSRSGKFHSLLRIWWRTQGKFGLCRMIRRRGRREGLNLKVKSNSPQSSQSTPSTSTLKHCWTCAPSSAALGSFLQRLCSAHSAEPLSKIFMWLMLISR